MHKYVVAGVLMVVAVTLLSLGVASGPWTGLSDTQAAAIWGSDPVPGYCQDRWTCNSNNGGFLGECPDGQPCTTCAMNPASSDEGRCISVNPYPTTCDQSSVECGNKFTGICDDDVCLPQTPNGPCNGSSTACL